jgi:hypothetical protein
VPKDVSSVKKGWYGMGIPQNKRRSCLCNLLQGQPCKDCRSLAIASSNNGQGTFYRPAADMKQPPREAETQGDFGMNEFYFYLFTRTLLK